MKSMTTFEQARVELAVIAQGEYRSMEYTTTTDSDGIESVTCRVYIHGYDGCTAATWRAALDAMRAKMNMPAIGTPDHSEAPQ